jgi:hypothetical protein
MTRDHGEEGGQERRPGPQIPVRTVMLAILGLTVVVLAIVSSYAIGLGNPRPRHVPVAVMAPPAALRKLEASPALGVYPVPGLARARAMVADRTVDGALLLPRAGRATVLVAGGGGHSVVVLLMQVGQRAATSRGIPLSIVDVAPTSPSDPDGTVEFYCIVFLMLGGSVGALVLGKVAGPVRGLGGALAHVGMALAYTAWLSVVVAFFTDIVFGDLVGHFWYLFLTLWLYIAAVFLAITGLSALVGQGSIVLIPVLIALGNPSSGGSVPRPLLNSFYSGLNPVLPQGAALSAVRGVQYFGDRGIALALACLLIWVLAGLVLLGAAVLRDAMRPARPAQ